MENEYVMTPEEILEKDQKERMEIQIWLDKERKELDNILEFWWLK